MILKLCDPQLSFNILSKFEINESKELAAANQNICALMIFLNACYLYATLFLSSVMTITHLISTNMPPLLLFSI